MCLGIYELGSGLGFSGFWILGIWMVNLFVIFRAGIGIFVVWHVLV